MEPAAPVAGTLERWFEVTSVFPLAGFALLHVCTYGRVLLGVTELGARESPSGFGLAAEALLVWAPLLFHVAAGASVWARRSRETVSGPSERASLALQRLTGVVLAAFLLDHFVRFRWPILQGVRYPAEAVGVLAGELSRLTFGVPLLAGFQLLGVLALAFHLGYGLWRVAARRARGSAATATRAACVAVGLVSALIGVLTVIRLATG